jgi:Fe-S-cluster-containing hydrogenase component 2
MADRQAVWVDVSRCTGCGVCVSECPVGAMALVDGKARVDEESCTECGACVGACPEDAVQPVIRGELVPASSRPAPTVFRPGPLAETAGAAVVVAGAGLLVRAGRALAQVLGRWLTARPAGGRPARPGSSRTGGGGGRGRRARRRRRGP